MVAGSRPWKAFFVWGEEGTSARDLTREQGGRCVPWAHFAAQDMCDYDEAD